LHQYSVKEQKVSSHLQLGRSCLALQETVCKAFLYMHCTCMSATCLLAVGMQGLCTQQLHGLMHVTTNHSMLGVGVSGSCRVASDGR
jgi:hypothetical protein